MAEKIRFGGQIVQFPAVRSRVRFETVSTPAPTPFGNVLIVDTGHGAGWGSGKSALSSGARQSKRALYTAFSLGEMQNLVNGGPYWLYAHGFFTPNPGTGGVSSVSYIRASDSSAGIATITDPLANTAATSFGSISFVSADEGTNANGTLDSNGVLIRGLGIRIIKDTVRSTAAKSYYFLEVLRSGYVGNLNGERRAYNGEFPRNTIPVLLYRTERSFNTWNELIEIREDSAVFRNTISLTTTGLDSSGARTTDGRTIELTDTNLEINTDDNGVRDITVFAGATETYSSDALAAALDVIRDDNTDYLFIADSGAKVSDDNPTLPANVSRFLNNNYKFQKNIVIAGFAGAAGVEKTRQLARNTDNQDTRIVYGDVILNLFSLVGERKYPVAFRAAQMLGREAALIPSNPVTLKPLLTSSIEYELTENERLALTDDGVMFVYFDNDVDRYVMSYGVNTLQRSNNLYNPDSTTYNIQVRRIINYVNKVVQRAARSMALGTEEGTNLNTVDDQLLINMTIGILDTLVADTFADNVLLSYRDINVTTEGTKRCINYGLEINSEVSAFFFTGTVIG